MFHSCIVLSLNLLNFFNYMVLLNERIRKIEIIFLSTWPGYGAVTNIFMNNKIQIQAGPSTFPSGDINLKYSSWRWLFYQTFEPTRANLAEYIVAVGSKLYRLSDGDFAFENNKTDIVFILLRMENTHISKT